MNLREQYMSETGYSAIAEYESDLNFSSRYVAWLEAKVEAHDKLVAELRVLIRRWSVGGACLRDDCGDQLDELLGVMTNCLTTAQLIAENEKQRQEAEWLKESEYNSALHTKEQDDRIAELESALAAERERVAKAVEACVKEIQEQHKSHVAWECDSDETICTIRRHFAAFDNSSGPG